MQAERWKRIEELCQVALELAPEKRARVPGAGLCGRCTARAAKGLQAPEIGDVAKGRRLLSGGRRGREKDQVLYGSVIARVVSDEGNIQLYGCGRDPGIRK